MGAADFAATATASNSPSAVAAGIQCGCSLQRTSSVLVSSPLWTINDSSAQGIGPSSIPASRTSQSLLRDDCKALGCPESPAIRTRYFRRAISRISPSCSTPSALFRPLIRIPFRPRFRTCRQFSRTAISQCTAEIERSSMQTSARRRERPTTIAGRSMTILLWSSSAIRIGTVDIAKARE